MGFIAYSRLALSTWHNSDIKIPHLLHVLVSDFISGLAVGHILIGHTLELVRI